jgi:hypothetical protein
VQGGAGFDLERGDPSHGVARGIENVGHCGRRMEMDLGRRG